MYFPETKGRDPAEIAEMLKFGFKSKIATDGQPPQSSIPIDCASESPWSLLILPTILILEVQDNVPTDLFPVQITFLLKIREYVILADMAIFIVVIYVWLMQSFYF